MEQRIVALESVLGFVLSEVEGREIDSDRFKHASERERVGFRRGWLESSLKSELEGVMSGLQGDIVSSSSTTGVVKEDRQSQERREEDEDEESDYSEVDLSLPPTHRPPQPPNNTTQSNSRSVSPHSPLSMPLLSSGKGGSSLNRGLVPRGTDPNAALGGFELDFGGSERDEDWVRKFVPQNSGSNGGGSRGRT